MALVENCSARFHRGKVRSEMALNFDFITVVRVRRVNAP